MNTYFAVSSLSWTFLKLHALSFWITNNVKRKLKWHLIERVSLGARVLTFREPDIASPTSETSYEKEVEGFLNQ